MQYLKIPFYLLLATLFVSCQDVIELDVPEGKTRLVVEGLLTDQDELQTILISNTKPYFAEQPIPKVTGANVSITDNTGETYILEETSPGIYQGKFAGIIGRSYQLSIITAEGERYGSLNETLNPVAPIDEIYYEFEKESAFNETEGNYVTIDMSDPTGKNDFYRWRFYVNGEKKDKAEDLYYAADRIFDGTEGLTITFSNHALKNNDHALVEQMSISEDAYNFLNLLYQQTANIGSQFDPPPAPVKGNIHNMDKAENYALGYFMVSAISVAEILIQGPEE